MNFTANAPGGLSDRGDQFYVMATTDTGNTTPTAQFVYGTATRTSSGAITYTQRGGADFGLMDQANNRIVIEIALSKLNPWVTHGPAIGPGSVLWGLRGSVATTRICTPSGLPVTECAGAFRDQTRGGPSFTFPGCGPTATLLSQFLAEDMAEGIRVTWGFGPTASIRSSSIERADTDQGPWSPLDAAVETRNGTSTAVDRSVATGRSTYYRLIATESDGQVHTFGPVSAIHGVDASAPIVSFVRGPSPNPAPGRCAVTFRVGRPGFVDLSVLDPSGRRVRTIQAGNLAPGEYVREWDGRTDHFSNAPSGMYFVVLHSADGKLTRRITLVR
jgi:flagellar hook capping protein FlgD